MLTVFGSAYSSYLSDGLTHVYRYCLPTDLRRVRSSARCDSDRDAELIRALYTGDAIAFTNRVVPLVQPFRLSLFTIATCRFSKSGRRPGKVPPALLSMPRLVFFPRGHARIPRTANTSVRSPKTRITENRAGGWLYRLPRVQWRFVSPAGFSSETRFASGIVVQKFRATRILESPARLRFVRLRVLEPGNSR